MFSQNSERGFMLSAISSYSESATPHYLWTLPSADADFSTRWRLIKTHFSHHCPERYKQKRSLSHLKKQEQAIWQRRFWEHQIREASDLERHVDYIHYNPVSHQLVNAPCDWPYSSFRRYVARGLYSQDWGLNRTINLQKEWE